MINIDSGYGGTGNTLSLPLQHLGVTLPFHLITSCSLYNLQTTLGNSVQLVLDKGVLDNSGKSKLNTMLVLHGVYTIQN